MKRRTFLALAAAAALPVPALATPGVSATTAAVAAIRSARGIMEGSGRGTLAVLFASWCPITRDFYHVSRGYLDRLTFYWVPFSGGLPEGLEPTERMLSEMTPASVAAAFAGGPYGRPAQTTPLTSQQDAFVSSRVAPLLRRDMGHGLATPTMGFTFGAGRARLLRGNPGGAALAEIAQYADA